MRDLSISLLVGVLLVGIVVMVGKTLSTPDPFIEYMELRQIQQEKDRVFNERLIQEIKEGLSNCQSN